MNCRRYPGRNKHHLRPKSRGGGNQDWNLLLIKVERHEAWHKIFGVMTAEEVLHLLKRVVKAKYRLRERHKQAA